jgi:hypothetical protein
MKTLVSENKKCASVCATIWLGARDRYVGGENTAVGFHGAYNKNTGQPGSMNVRIGVYLGYPDLSYDAVDWILGAPPLAIRWLTPETSKRYSWWVDVLWVRHFGPRLRYSECGERCRQG